MPHLLFSVNTHHLSGAPNESTKKVYPLLYFLPLNA